MSKSTKIKICRTIACFLAITLCFSGITLSVEAQSSPRFADTTGHWAEQSIHRWADLGVVQGADGLFRPNDSVTRAELAAILSRLLKYPAQPENPFSDFDERAWFYQYAKNLVAVSAFPMTEGNFNGSEALTRQEAAHIIARAFGVHARPTMRFFDDIEQADAWARSFVNTMRLYYFIRGFPDGTFRPQNLVTRAEITSILDNMVYTIIDAPGTYGGFPRGAGILITSGGVTITPHPELQHTVYHIFVSPAVNDGTVTLEEGVHTEGVHVVGQSASVLVRHGGGRAINFTFLVSPEGDARFTGLGTAQSPLEISTVEQLRLISEFVGSEFSQKHFALANDIVLTENWRPIGRATLGGTFYGTFDGKGYTISNISITDRFAGGLFYSINGTIRDLNLQGEVTDVQHAGLLTPLILGGHIYNVSATANIKAVGNNSQGVYAGVIAGRLQNGTIENSRVFGNVSATQDSNRRARIHAGGLVGNANTSAKIINSHADVNVSLFLDSGYFSSIAAGGLVGRAYHIESSSASGDVELKFNNSLDRQISPGAGGLIGTMWEGTITDSSATGNVQSVGGHFNFAGGLIGAAGTITLQREVLIERSYATGNVSSSGSIMQNNAGGFVGQLENGIISESWSSGSVTVSGNPGFFNSAGGFAGSCYEGGVILNSYTLSDVSSTGCSWSVGAFVGRFAGRIENSYSAGDVVPNFFIGSQRSSPTLVNNGVFFRNSPDFPAFISLHSWSPSITGITETQLTDATTFTTRGWDFENVWMFSSSVNYNLPILRNVNVDLQSRH